MLEPYYLLLWRFHRLCYLRLHRLRHLRLHGLWHHRSAGRLVLAGHLHRRGLCHLRLWHHGSCRGLVLRCYRLCYRLCHTRPRRPLPEPAARHRRGLVLLRYRHRGALRYLRCRCARRRCRRRWCGSPCVRVLEPSVVQPAVREFRLACGHWVLEPLRVNAPPTCPCRCRLRLGLCAVSETLTDSGRLRLCHLYPFPFLHRLARPR